MSIVLVLVVALVAVFRLPHLPSANVSLDGKRLNGEPIQIKMGTGPDLRGHFRSWSPYEVAPNGKPAEQCEVTLLFHWGTGSERQVVRGHLSENGCVLTFAGSVPVPRNPESGTFSIGIHHSRAGQDTIIFRNPVQFVR